MARLQHPNVTEVIDVPDSAVGQHAMSGWVPAEGEPAPTCPTCHQVWPAYAEQQPKPEEKTEEAPAESGASASEETSQPKRRRGSSSKSEESE